MNTEELNIIIKNIRSKGFPHYEASDKFRKNALKKFLNYDFWKEDKFLESYPDGSYGFGVLHSGIRYLWSYFSQERATVKCGHFLTPMEAFESDQVLMDVLMYHLQEHKEQLSGSALRDWLLKHPSVQCISNFRPTAAAAIYDVLLPFDESIVWDPCMGYGGRLLGAVKADKVKMYIGTEPNTATFNKLTVIKNELQQTAQGSAMNYDLINSPLEDYENLSCNGVDLVFTSPPYFDTEKYSNETTQSWVRYSDYEQWKEKFLKVLIDKAFYCLRPKTGILALNVKDCKNCIDLESSTINYALKRGFVLKRVHKYLLSNYNGKRSNFEPIFEFWKP